MKKLVSILMMFIIILTQFVVLADKLPEIPEDLRSNNILLVDWASGKVIYEKNSTQQIQPGGICKILTAAIIINNEETLEQNITADADAVNSYDFSLNNMGILAFILSL